MLRERKVVVCGCLLAWAACAEGAIWLDVPFVKQEKNGCGAASLAMVIGYWARNGSERSIPEQDPRQIQQALYSRDAGGIRSGDMERYLRQNGFFTFVFQGEWNDLERHLSKGRPLVVCLNESRGGPLHYVVVAGLVPNEHVVLVNDPARRKLLKMGEAEFQKDWNSTSRWTLLAVPRPGR